MRTYAVIEKLVGETPLMAIETFRKTEPSLRELSMTYAGRLDPMASGKLVVLIGDACKSRAPYDALDKTYIFEVLLGFSSDTGDVLGLPEVGALISATDARAQEVASALVGKHTFPYPVYSSKNVKGKPLFTYALANELSSIEIPTVDVRIYSMRYLDRIVLPKDELIERVLDKIELLKVRHDVDELGADFRKEQIMKQWWSLQDRRKTPCTILRFETTVSAGTYMRTLAPRIAKELGTIGLAYSIKRTKIGRFQPLLAHRGVWLRTL